MCSTQAKQIMTPADIDFYHAFGITSDEYEAILALLQQEEKWHEWNEQLKAEAIAIGLDPARKVL
jgi:hypothetical protein